MKNDLQATETPRAIASESIHLIEYLLERNSVETKRILPIHRSAAAELQLAAAIEAQQHFRRVTGPALRYLGKLQVDGGLGEVYEDALERFIGEDPIPVVDLLAEAVEDLSVREILDRNGVSKGLIGAVIGVVKESQATVSTQSGALVVNGPNGVRRFRNDTDGGAMIHSEHGLRSLSRTWSSHGRGFLPVIQVESAPGEVELDFSEGLVSAFVSSDMLLEADIRTLEDTDGLPAFTGQAVAGAISAGIFALGAVLVLIGACIDDETVSRWLILIGFALILLGAAVGIASGVPTRVCRTDPDTGLTTCTAI